MGMKTWQHEAVASIVKKIPIMIGQYTSPNESTQVQTLDMDQSLSLYFKHAINVVTPNALYAPVEEQ